MATDVGSVLSVEDLLARSKAAAANRNAGGSKVQQMLAGVEESDTVDLSPVAKLLKSQQAEKSKNATPYTEQDWYINAKVSQLRGQIQLYSNLPGLDPSGAIMQSLEKEVYALVSKQQAKLKASKDEEAAKQAELDAVEAAKKNAPISVDDLLKRAKLHADGQDVPKEISDDVQKLLDQSKGSLVNKTA